MKIELTPEMEELVRGMLATGGYKDAQAVVLDSLRFLAEEEAWKADVRGRVEDDAWKADVRQKIEEGMKQMRAGQLVDGEKAMAEILRDLRKRHGKGRGA